MAILVDAAPDAIQLTVGQAPLLQQLPGREKPSLVLRTDVANVYGKDLPRTLFSRMIENPVEQALRLGSRLIMMHEGRIILDIGQEQKRKTTVQDLLHEFEKIKGGALDDRTMLQ